MINKSGRLGMIVRMDQTGLGNQTLELARMLKPAKILIIDSTPFKPYAKQFPEWYNEFNVRGISNGFPKRREKTWLLQGIDTLLTCELPYGYDILQEAKRRGIKTFLQYNYEFLDYLNQPILPKPTTFIAPSKWGVEDVKQKLKVEPVILRPPLDINKFANARQVNMSRKGKRRLLHIQGIKAMHDRNGTDSLLEAIKLIPNAEFELVIKSQYEYNTCDDPRVIFDNCNPESNQDLYTDFDALIMPRRYGGLCLPMNEALASGLPVIMTDISPNDDLLPERWLVPAEKTGEFMTRTMIDIYSVNIKLLAMCIDSICSTEYNRIQKEKELAFSIAYENFSSDVLEKRYREVLGL